jgi:hypothetical protein
MRRKVKITLFHQNIKSRKDRECSLLNSEQNVQVSPETILKLVQHMVQDKFTTEVEERTKSR